MRDQYLTHVTMSTGHVRKSYRNEVDDAAVQWAREAVQQAISLGHVPLPPLGPDWRLACTRERSSTLLCSVWNGLAVVVTFGVAGSSRYAGKLWQALVDTAPPEVPVHASIAAPRGAPWVAARLELGAANAGRDALMMLGDMERCVGWGFLEIIDEGQ